MNIELFPFLNFGAYSASVEGDVVTVNGKSFDLSPLPDGYRILAAEVGCEYFVPTTYVERKNGVLHATMFLHVEAETVEQFRNPEIPIVLIVDSGAVPFPDTTPPAVETPEINPPPAYEQKPIPEVDTAEASQDDQLEQ